MENGLKNLCGFIQELVKLESTLLKNKLSNSEVKTLLGLVDVRGKGYLDLSDVYDLVGKVSEGELFAVFKFLDRERNGEIRLPQLQAALADPSLASNHT
jgi:Ca2+-binding EF-hand superfamily protein